MTLDRRTVTPALRLSRAVESARNLVEIHHFTRALKVIELLLRHPLEDDTRFELMALRIQALIDNGDHRKAEVELHRAALVASTQDQHDDIALLRAHRLALMSSARAALHDASSVLQRCGRCGDRAAKAYWIVGVALFRACHLQWARECLEISAAHYRLAGATGKLAQVIENMALVLKNQGKIAAALDLLDQAMRIYSRSKLRRLKPYCQLHRGICLVRLGEIQEARTSLVDAARMAHEAHLPVVYFSAQSHLRHILRMQQDYQAAREFYEEAFRLAEETGVPRKQALALEFLGETLIDEGRPQEALALLNQALAIARPLAGRGDLVMLILRRRGEAKVACGDRMGGLGDLRRAIALCHARGEVREEWLAQRALVLGSGLDAESFAKQMEAVLRGIEQVQDRFEYSRTVCRALEAGKLELARSPWLAAAHATATHYFTSMGLHAWSKRLAEAGGHAARLREESTRPHHPTRRPEHATATAAATASDDPTQTRSPLFSQALEAARIASNSREPALILGETGAGKEVIARLVHAWSQRAAKPLVAVNCGAIPENLIESELFGHVRGAFTGAERDRLGLFETAHEGTVLLDEIGDLPADVQVKLLRFLDHYEFHRLGEHRTREVDVRILAATHKDLSQLVESGQFRRDLFFRLNVFTIELPALRQRPEDVTPLFERFLTEESRGASPPRATLDLKRWLEAYEWPGNVRELRNLSRYLAVRCWGKTEIEPQDLPVQLRTRALSFLSGKDVSHFEREKVDLERTQILRALEQSGGRITAASALLGISRNNLARRIRHYKIDPHSLPTSSSR